jgi:hypothetical protein
LCLELDVPLTRPHRSRSSPVNGTSFFILLREFHMSGSFGKNERHLSGLYSIVERGLETGTVLWPHKGKDGRYVASLSRYAKDYVKVDRYEDLHGWLLKGYRLRMSNPDSVNHRAPSLIAPGSIRPA